MDMRSVSAKRPSSESVSQAQSLCSFGGTSIARRWSPQVSAAGHWILHQRGTWAFSRQPPDPSRSFGFKPAGSKWARSYGGVAEKAAIRLNQNSLMRCKSDTSRARILLIGHGASAQSALEALV